MMIEWEDMNQPQPQRQDRQRRLKHCALYLYDGLDGRWSAHLVTSEDYTTDARNQAEQMAIDALLPKLRLVVVELEALAGPAYIGAVAEAAAEAIHETVPPLPSIVTTADALDMAEKKIGELETERDEHWEPKAGGRDAGCLDLPAEPRGDRPPV